jgi:integrase
MFRRLTRERYLSDAELRRFMEAVRTRRHVNQPRDHAFFALLANTGMRPSEARALTRGDVHFKSDRVWVHVHRMRRKHAPAPITDLVLPAAVGEVVRRYAETLPVDARLFGFTKRQSGRLFHHYCKKAGVPDHYRLYAIRHSFGLRLWSRTRDLRLIQGIMGHVRLKASATYVHVSVERLRGVVDQLGTIG